MTSALNKRNYSLDLLRIVATLAVVMIHCSAYFVTRYGLFSDEFVLGNIFDSISRIGVPLFLMISGALFLDENKAVTLKGILRKNVLSLGAITLIWAAIYALTDVFLLNPIKPVTLKSLADLFVDGYYHMWYLYMIIGLYIITPFLRKFVSKKNGKMVLFFIITCFTVRFVVPLLDKIVLHFAGVDYLGVLVNKLKLGFFGDYVIYFVAGWYLCHVGINKKCLRCIIYALGACSLMFMILYVHFTGDYKTVYDNIGVPVFVYAVSVFVLLTNVKFKPSERGGKLLGILSRLTFGVYIIHAMVLEFYFKWLPYKSGAFLYLAVCFAVVLAVSVAISFAISKIPVIKKLVRG